MSDKHLSAEELIAQDSGARLPEGIMAQVIAGLALLWSLFHSGLPHHCHLCCALVYLTTLKPAQFT